MCGIAGFLDFSGQINEGDEVLRQMSDAVSHRGPDGDGHWSEDGVVFLGHRRLAIVELSDAGRQPMASACGRFMAIFNGEIYNYEDLRSELLKRRSGFKFRGHSDTEVLVESFSLWGVQDTLARINGMFAIAVWDRKEKILSLIRDRLGEKPIYVAEGNKVFFFSSEIKSLKKCPGINWSLDHSSVAAMLQYGYVPAPASIYQNVKKVLPGHVMEIGKSGSKVWTYWDAEQKLVEKKENFFAGTFADATRELDRLVTKSVQRQMQADVDLGAFLSGGVDSSLVSAVMQSLSSKKVKTYSIGFENAQYDEAPFAKAVAKHIGSEHTEFYLSDQDILNVIPLLPKVYDEPFSDSSQLPMILLSKMARSDVTVALSGDGGDELFGGYQRYLTLDKILPRIMKIPVSIRAPVSSLLQNISQKDMKRMVAFGQKVLPKVSRLDEKILKAAPLLKAKDVRDAYEAILSIWRDNIVLGQASREDLGSRGFLRQDLPLLDQMILSDLKAYLPDGVLVKVDRAAMSVSLETRAPLLDKDIAEFSLNLPNAYKVRNGMGKVVLRNVLDKYVPRELIERPKMGFSVPLGDWLRGPLKSWASDLLSHSRIRSEGLLNADLIDKRWREHLSGKKDWSQHLWTVLVFEQWLSQEKF